MNKTIIRWLLAIIITLSAAFYQRTTGPSYPLRGEFSIADEEISYRLPRSHESTEDQTVTLSLPDKSLKAFLHYKRYKTNDEWTKVEMKMWSDDHRTAVLPQQPPAGKLEYYITLGENGTEESIPEKSTVIIRFKGHVPAGVLTPHIIFMFVAMFLSNLTALEAFVLSDKLLKYTFITTLFFIAGGMILGPIVQKYAFGAFWTGVPFGYDLTDNKLLIGVLGWVAALWRVRFGGIRAAKWWVIGAAVLILVIYSIPHSMMGSELDYNKMEIVTGD
ncbi:MAG: hypothetical protein AB7T22_05330 [Calditrichaceae bacterium]